MAALFMLRSIMKTISAPAISPFRGSIHTPRNSCVRFVFGIAAASRNTRLRVACWALPGPDSHRLIAPADWHLPSLGHLIGAGEQCRCEIDADRFGSLQVDHQLELGRLLDGQVGRFRAPQDLGELQRPLRLGLGELRAVGKQAAEELGNIGDGGRREWGVK